MRTILSIIAFISFAGFSQAADIVCSCKGTENKCSDIEINFVDSNPGVYMTIEYAYGERNLEGFASVRRDSKKKEVVYRLGNFTLLQKDGKYSLPLRKAVCN